MTLSVHHPLLSFIFSSLLATCVDQQATPCPPPSPRPCLPDPHSSMWLWADSSLFVTRLQRRFLRLSHCTHDRWLPNCPVSSLRNTFQPYLLQSPVFVIIVWCFPPLVPSSPPLTFSFWVSFIYFKIFPHPALLTVGVSLGSVVALLFLLLGRFSLDCGDPAQMWWSAPSTWVLSVGS